MKRGYLFIGILLILAVVLSTFIGCGGERRAGERRTAAPPVPVAVPGPAEPVTLTAITVTPSSVADLDAGSTQQFTAIGTYSDGSTAELFSVTWKSDNPQVATIDYNGIAKGVGAGKANITASLGGITSAPVSLTVVGAAPVVTMTPLPVMPKPETPAVFVSVSVDSKLVIAANPIAYTEDMTLEDVIKAAHEAYYPDGASGCDISTNNAFNMYMVNKCWGIAQIPFIIVNDHPNSEKTFEAVNTVKVAPNDNIILCTSSVQGGATPVSVRATRSGDSVTLTVTSWILNLSNFTYSTAPLKDAAVWDPATGMVLGRTDDKGSITVNIPECGIVAIEGLAAINVRASATVQ